MLRSPFVFCCALFCASLAGVAAQTPAPSPSATPQRPVTPTTESLVNSLNAPDLEQLIQLLKSNYINPNALNETELTRSTAQGLLARIGRGAMLLPADGSQSSVPASPFYAEVLDGHIGYLRLGALVQANLQAMDTNIQAFTAKKIDALVVDLRASEPANDFATAAEFAKRFCPKGKTLFTLRKGSAKQERVFASDREPSYHGLMIVLADGETAGAAETIAGVLRLYDKALIVGQNTAGRAVEYSDLPLPSGTILRVAVAEAILPEGGPLFPDGLKADVPVEMPLSEKRQIFQKSIENGMSQFVFESERPHLNEAALMAGRNPDLEAQTAARGARGPEKGALHDRVLQRAVDVVTSLAIFQRR